MLDFKELILAEHREIRRFFERSVLQLVPRELFTARPGDTGNSIAWLMWHLARVEDVVVNTIVRGAPQVLVTQGWGERMRVDDPRIGTGFQEAEVAALSRTVDADALDAYWQGVRRATADWLPGVSVAALDAVPDLEGRLRGVPPLVPAEAGWLLDFWRGRPVAWFVRFPLINHGYLHLGEMHAIRGRLGIRGR